VSFAIPKAAILAELRAEKRRLGSGTINQTNVATLSELERRIADLPDEAARRVTVSMVQIRTGVFSTCPNIMRLYQTAAREAILTPFAKSAMAIQAKIVLGLKPTDLFIGLTSKEAHHALVLGCKDPRSYVLRDVLAGTGDMTAIVTRTLTVSRWVAACFGDDERKTALLAPRVDAAVDLAMRGEVTVNDLQRMRYLDRLDEIEECDLTSGVSTGVRAAFAASAARLARQNELAIRERRMMSGEKLAELIPSWWKPIRCARLLTTPEELSTEGREMHHCVGSYYSRVMRGESIIVAIRVPDRRYPDEATKGATLDGVTPSLARRLLQTPRSGARAMSWRRSTVEYSPTGQRIQHYGPYDRTPHPLCIRALKVCEAKWFGKGLYEHRLTGEPGHVIGGI
jgi:hypothetical protein